MTKLRAVLSALTYGAISAKSPIRYTGRHTGWLAGSGATGGPLDAMAANSTLFSIVRLNATSTAQVDWHLFRKKTDGRRVYGPVDGDRREVTQHAALNLLNKPNPLMTRNELVERAQQHIDLAGECFWVVERVGSIPIELWPARPDRMEEVPSDDGKSLQGWIYNGPDGEKVPFLADEVIHIQMPSPTNPYRGISPVHSLLVDLESASAASRYNLKFFRNSAAPGGVIEAERNLSDPEFDEFNERWRETHQGVSNAHRVAILENGMKWIDAKNTMRDMQFAELRNLSREMIREGYGTHAHMLGMSEDVNRANADAASADYARWQQVPRLERFKLALNEVLLPMFGVTDVEFDYDNPVPENEEACNAERDSKVKAACMLIDRGFDPEETLAAIGLPPIAHSGQPAVPRSLEAVA